MGNHHCVIWDTDKIDYSRYNRQLIHPESRFMSVGRDVDDIIKKLEAGETISEKTIVMDEKGFDATTITDDDVNNYGI